MASSVKTPICDLFRIHSIDDLAYSYVSAFQAKCGLEQVQGLIKVATVLILLQQRRKLFLKDGQYFALIA